jgi:ADP-heptose:LPS heptosyltransferase
VNLAAAKKLDYYLGGALIALGRPAAMLLGRLLRRDHDPAPRGDIVVLKLLGGGSLVLAAPALEGIKATHPSCRLLLVTTPGVAPFAELLGLFDEVNVLDDRSLARLVASAVRCWRRSHRVDTVIDLEVYSRLSTVWSLLTLARNRIGFYLETVFWRRNVHTHLLFFNRFSPVHAFYEHVARLVGASAASRETCAERLLQRLPRVARADSGIPRIALGHACSELGRERMLSPEQWRDFLASRGFARAEFHLLGGPADRDGADAIVRACAVRLPTSIHNHCGIKTLAESVAFLSTCDAYIGIDSALLHFARLLGIPTVSVWGPTDPATRLQPFPGARDEVIYRKISCSPCIHVAEEPPCRGNNVCISTLLSNSGETAEPMWVIVG